MDSSALDIREATVEDVPALVTLYRRAYAGNERLGFPSRMTAVDRERVQEWLRTRSVFVARHRGEIVGAAHVIRRSDWDVPELGRLAVAPAHQERGIGTRLLEYGETQIRSAGWERLRLRTLSGHPFLEDWYRRRGYERIGVEYLDDRPHDAPVLEKEL